MGPPSIVFRETERELGDVVWLVKEKLSIIYVDSYIIVSHILMKPNILMEY